MVLRPLAIALLLVAPQDKIRVLIVDGQNNHNYKAMTPFMKDQLEKSGLFAVDVSTSPPASARPGKNETPERKEAREKANAGLKAQWDAWRPKFKDYKVVISNYNGEPWPTEVNDAFTQFVQDGGGFHAIHAANNEFGRWKEYNQMIGLGWRDNKFGFRVIYNDKDELVRIAPGQDKGAGHGAQHEFKVKVRDPEHPITKGLPPEWMHATDELYHGQRGPAENMRILASAFDDKSKGGTGVQEPMLWIIPFGKGQCVTNVMGHENGKSLQCVGFLTVFLRSTEWLATGKVTIPVPANFPTADKVSSVTAK